MKNDFTIPGASIFRWSSLVLALVMFLSLAMAQPVHAQLQTLAVTRYVAPTGSDDIANDCTNPAAPCLTIQNAINLAQPDDVINVASGTYTSTAAEVVLINKSLALLGGWDLGFTSQNGASFIDGQEIRRGIKVESGSTALVDHFAIQNGFHNAQGGGIYNAGNLTLNNSAVINNVSMFQGGGIFDTGTLTINNTTISGNSIPKDYPYYGGAIYVYTTGVITVNNSTIAGNTQGGFWISGSSSSAGHGIVNMRNTILAQNASEYAPECTPGIISQGFNLFGNAAGCHIVFGDGDMIGANNSPINPRLATLSDNGGKVPVRALSDDSPALNAGSLAAPGSDDPTACLLTDQRGSTRQGRCDIGAYEGSVPTVRSIQRVNPSPTSTSFVYFDVTFSSPVTGVGTTAPFSNFKLVASGVTGARIREVTGEGKAYTVKVYTGNGNGTLRLDVRDTDLIVNAEGTPLGGPGLLNGDFKKGKPYSMIRIPNARTPRQNTWQNKPTFRWTSVPGATQYGIQVWKGTTLVYAFTYSAACNTDPCYYTSRAVLPTGDYEWRIRALTQGTWKAYSRPTTFTVIGAKPGHWTTDLGDFYIPPDQGRVRDFSIWIYVPPCGSRWYKITAHSAQIVNGSFGVISAMHFEGSFDSTTTAHGGLYLNYYYISGCGYIKSDWWKWTATWTDSSQPNAVMQSGDRPFEELILKFPKPLPVWLEPAPATVQP